MKVLKRFWLFLFWRHYPNGGLLDLHGRYDNVEEAEKAGKDYIKSDPNDYYYQVYDSHKDAIVSDNIQSYYSKPGNDPYLRHGIKKK